MNRHRAYWPLDDAPSPFGDGAWSGVNARLDPGQLGPGVVSDAVNARFDRGRIENRKGARIMTWGAPIGVSLNPELVPPFGPSRRAAAFSDPVTGKEWVIVIRDGDDDIPLGQSYRSRPGNRAQTIPAPPDTDFSTATDLIQAFNGVLLLRGTDDPLYLENIDEGWKAPPEVDPPDATKERIPPCSQGVFFQNRVFAVDARTDGQHLDSVWVSDFGNASSVLAADAVFQSFRINQGGADRLVAVVPFGKESVVALKQRSVWIVTGVKGTNEELAGSAVLDKVTDQYGCLAPRSAVRVGKDLWFLGHKRGVCSISQTAQNEIQGVDVPVSADIQGVIDRINWEAAANAVAATFDNRVFFAVPLDGADDNNAILVYSTLTQQWAGYDMSPATKVRDWVRFTYGGAVRLGYLSTGGHLYLYEDGYYDQSGDEAGHITNHEIELAVATRGYGGTEAGRKRFTRLGLRWKSWHLMAEVSVETDGVNESQVVKAIETDRTRYLRPHGAPAWDPTNVNEDWDTPFREDYSIDFGVAGGVKIVDADGVGIIRLNEHQQNEATKSFKASGEFAVVRVVTTRGRIEIGGIAVDSGRASTRPGTTL